MASLPFSSCYDKISILKKENIPNVSSRRAILWLLQSTTLSCFVFEGVRKKYPQNLSLWRVDYFKLKAIKTQQTQEKISSPL